MSLRVVLICAVLVGCSGRDFECPDGTSEQRNDSAGVHERWCARPDGTKHGPHETRTKEYTLGGQYADGQQHGIWRYRDSRSGFLATYVLDHGTGLVVEWHPGLRKKSEQELRGGVADGVRTDYAPNGQIRSVSFFSDGVPAGTWYEWAADGTETAVRQHQP